VHTNNGSKTTHMMEVVKREMIIKRYKNDSGTK